MLESYCFRAPTNRDLTVTLLSVGHSRLSIPTSSWTTMQTFIKELLCSWYGSSEDVAVKKAVDILEKRTLASEPGHCASTLSAFRPLFAQNPEQNEIHFTGGVHCGTTLIMIGKYIQDVLHGGSDEDLMSFCKVRIYIYGLLPHHNTFYIV